MKEIRNIKTKQLEDPTENSTFVELPDGNIGCSIQAPENVDIVPDDYINMVLEDAESFTSDDFGKDTREMDTAFQNYIDAAIGEINTILENVAMNLKHYQDVKNVRTGAQICKLMAKKVD